MSVPLTMRSTKTGGLVFNDTLARQILPQVAAMYQKGVGMLGGLLPPEQIFRPDDFSTLPGREIANWIWAQGFSQRSGKQASDILGHLYRVLIDYPELTTLDQTCSDDRLDQLCEEIRYVEPFANGIKQIHRDRVQWWKKMWQFLRDTCDGDPRFYFMSREDRSLTVPQQRDAYIKAMVKDFTGVEHKVAQLMMFFFQEYHRNHGWNEHKDFWDRFATIPMCPVDIHHMRFVQRTGLIKSYKSDYREKIARPISDWLAGVCLENQIDHLDLAQAIFNIGATIHARYDMIADPLSKQAHCVMKCPLHRLCIYTVRNDETQNLRKHAKTTIALLNQQIDAHNPATDSKSIQALQDQIDQLIKTEQSLERNRGSMQWHTITPRNPDAIAAQAAALVANLSAKQPLLFAAQDVDRTEKMRTIRDVKLARVREIIAHPGDILGRAKRRQIKANDHNLQSTLIEIRT
jgi:hypothetical protein